MQPQTEGLAKRLNNPPRPAPLLWRLPPGLVAWVRRGLQLGPLFGPGPTGKRARLGLVITSLVYTFALSFVALAFPRVINFDLFFLFGCALVAWAVGIGWTAVLVIAVSAGVLFYRDLWLGAPGARSWMAYWNLAIHLLAYGGIAWWASESGKLTRDLELRVQERTSRLRTEIARRQQTAELLGEAVQLFRQVTENIADVFWVTDAAKTEVEYISPGFEAVWGKSCDELYRSPAVWREAIHPEDRPRVERAMFRKQAGGDYDEEYRVLRPDGSIRWVHDRAFPVKDEQGAVYRIVGIAEDITERKQSERLLQAERDLGAALSTTSQLGPAAERVLEIATQLPGIDCGGVYLMDQHTGELHLHASRGLPGSFVERVAHYRADAAETRLARAGRITYVGNEQIPRSLEALWGSQGLRALAVVPLQHKNVVLGMLNLASFSEDEIPPRLRLGIELIASQVAAALARIGVETSLRESEARLRALINSAPIALLAFDAQGIITFEDGQALGAMGAKPGEHVGRSAVEVFEDFPLMLSHLRRAQRPEDFSSIVEFGEHVLECRFTPLKNQDAANGFVAVATNITERSRLEQQILEISDREQARIGQDIHDGLCQQLVGAAFAANSLKQDLGLLHEAGNGARQAERICTLLDEAITESRRVARGLYPVRLETEGLGPALAELARVARERFPIDCRCEFEGTEVQSDTRTATHLYRIAQEALNNALKHSEARTIRLTLRGSNAAIELEIQDDGKGMREMPDRPAGMGLYTMNYRARSIGGTLRRRSDTGGTLISCHVPKSE